MGFDAIWISPVVENIANVKFLFKLLTIFFIHMFELLIGYHGYWAQDFYTLNSYFGDEDTFSQLASAIHERGMYLMIDVVANHVGNPPITTTMTCPMCNIEDWNDQSQVEQCRLSGLPDLNQSVSYVNSSLCDWVSEYVVGKWKADGLRIDTVSEVHPDPFWTDFARAAGVYAVGEVDNGDPTYVGPYQNYLPGVLNYPMFYSIRNAFGAQQSISSNLLSMAAANQQDFKDWTLLGTFVDNHDNDRFLCDYPDAVSVHNSKELLAGNCSVNDQSKQDCGYVGITESQCTTQSCCWQEVNPNPNNYPWCYYPLGQSSSYRQYENALNFVLTYVGIPIIYYGTEQAFHGCQDPNNREPLWPSSYDTTATLYQFLQVVITARKTMQIWSYNSWNVVYSANNALAYTRGSQFLVLLTNVGDDGSTLSLSFNPQLSSGKYCNVFWPSQDCFTYSSGSVAFSLLSGETKIYIPSDKISDWSVNYYKH
ncbi:hypothetical protein RFI_10090 [Reticulomyxa filosa]|uniref:alpha-amylase n=1 Tax=Reticulomyxa filosa TaxID=46433 RepID=X6NL78_RETFI|nr:hypothetical protein RFI_10090 [Reticulomyxa filosa]|eukprot:ETO27040.1 hypothetical protein RFI_10090 [Reticulomyxa filosa]